MRFFKDMIAIAGSRWLTVWLAGSFILYYLTMAVWSKEAFGTFVTDLSRSALFRGVYLVFLLNLSLRTLTACRALRHAGKRLFLRLPLYLGLIMFLAAFLLSVNFRQSVWQIVGEGDRLGLPWEAAPFEVRHIESALEKKPLVDRESAVFRFEPAVHLVDAQGRSHRVGAFPAVPVGSSYLHVLNFGLGPGVELSRNGQVLSRTEHALRLVPFGNTDMFEVPPFPYRFYLTVVPNQVIRKGKETARTYDLERPRYKVKVMHGDRNVAETETGEGLLLDDRTAVKFLPPADWVLLEAVYDPFHAWFLAGLLLVLAGAVLYPFSFLFRT
jgi:hypothetical protein